MPGIKVFIKGLNKVIDFPANTSMPDIEKHIKGNWSQVEEMSGLPMDTASRMERAKYMGFEPDKTFYHGTDADISSFSSDKFGSATGSRSAKEGVWLTDSPDTARSYAEFKAKSVPVSDELKKADIAEARGDWDAYDKHLVNAEKLEADIYDQPNRGQNIMPLSSRGKFKEFDAKGEDFIDIQDDINSFIASAKSEGYDGATFKNLSDDVGFSGKPSTHKVVFDPKNIRSTNAAFNPAKKESANLLAGLGTAAVGLSMLAPEEVEASFLGQGAKKAAKDMLGMANKMENAGVDPDEIWQKTGWGKGADNKWRFEVSDDVSKIRGDDRDYNKEIMDTFGTDGGADKRKEIMGAKKRIESTPAPHEETNLLSGVLDHPELYEQHPDLKNVLYQRDPRLELGEAYYKGADDIVGMSETNRFATKSPLLHETQHAIQAREGFAKGGNLESMEIPYSVREPIFKAATALAEKRAGIDKGVLAAADAALSGNNKLSASLIKKLNPEDKKEALALYRYGASIAKQNKMPLASLKGMEDDLVKKANSMDAFARYERLAGETEARNVQTRLKMTPEERRATPPWKTEDVPRSEQIVKYGGAGGAVGLAGLSAEDAQAYTDFRERQIASQQQSEVMRKMGSRINDPLQYAGDIAKLPSHLQADLGGYQAPERAESSLISGIQRAGSVVSDFELPIIGSPLGGLGEYMRNFGYNDTPEERFKRAGFAALDFF